MRITFLTKSMMIVFFVIVAYISIVRIQYLDVYFKKSCLTEPGDELPYIDDTFKPKKHSIFVLETSCMGRLNSRQACTIESVARLHPLWDIHVIFISRVKDLKQWSFITLKKFRNVKFSRLNLEEYSRGTPLEELVTSGTWMRNMWWKIHASDLLRYLTLYKWSGIYLDLDALVVKPLGDLAPNWAARESDWTVSAGAMAFSSDAVGRMVAEQCVWDLAKNWRDDIWGNNGPGVIHRVLREICHTQNASEMNANHCLGFEVYHPSKFYPIEWRSALQYFKPPTTTYPDAYIHHIWNHITHDKYVYKGSLYDLLAREHCPDIYMTYGNDFGM